MGGYYGHLIPGMVVAVYGSLWTVLGIVNYFYEERLKRDRRRRRRENGHDSGQREPKRLLNRHWLTAMNNYAWLPFPCVPYLPADPIVRVAACGFGVLIELCIEIDRKGKLYLHLSNFTRHPVDPEKIQHATIWAFYCLGGVLDLVVHFGCCRVPKKAGRVFIALAYMSQAIILFMHNAMAGDASRALDHRVHLIMASGALATGVAAVWRIAKERDLFANLFFSFWLTFQGTWLMQAGSTLWTNVHLWKTDNMGDVMYISVIAFWHVLAQAVFVFAVWFVVWVVSCVLPDMPRMQGWLARLPCGRRRLDSGEVKPMLDDARDLNELA